MKTVLVIYEGAADLPVADLEGRTPLQVARCVHANRLAASGQCGLLNPAKEGLDGRPEVLLAELCGTDPDAALTLFRGPLEAAATGEDLNSYPLAYRANLVTLDHNVMVHGQVAHLSLTETQSLAQALQAAWSPTEVKFVVGAPGFLIVLMQSTEERSPVGVPPGLMEGEPVETFLPGGKSGAALREITAKAAPILQGHPVNEVRTDLGEDPANGLWLWGGGRPLKSFSLFNGRSLSATVLTKSRWVAGLAKVSGWPRLELQEPWNPEISEPPFKVAPLVESLRESDFLLAYLEAPLELGRYGSGVDKLRALERIDQFFLGPLLDVLDAHRPYRILLCAEGVVSSENQHPTSGNIPILVAGEGVAPDAVTHWDEVACAVGRLGRVNPAQAWELLWTDQI